MGGQHGGAEVSAALHHLLHLGFLQICGEPIAQKDGEQQHVPHTCPAPVPHSFPSSLQASQLGVYRAFVDNYGVAMETAEKCCQANAQFAEISEVRCSDRCTPVLPAVNRGLAVGTL